jgi:hypothetical protein
VTRQRLGWAQGRLLPNSASEPPQRFRVSSTNGWGPAVGQLALAVAQARSAASAGHDALICADDGTAVLVTRCGDGFDLAALDDAGWATSARRLLSRLS